MIKLFLVLLLISLALFGTYAVYANSVNNYATSKSTEPPDPNRPTYDVWGNKFTYNGKLLKVSAECVDPISHKHNPYCN